MLALHLVFFFVTVVVGGEVSILPRQSCGEAFEICSPDGTTNLELPPVGPELGSLYTSLVQAVSSEGTVQFRSFSDATSLVRKQVANVFCCALTSECLLLLSYGVPFCWDRFTTDYYFPDGSFGSVVAGNYSSASGTIVNLIYGNWESRDGATGNIYSNTSSMMPDTSTLRMPTPWTSSGIGSVIPASELGSSTDITAQSIEAPTITITALTLPSTTITVGTSECTHCSFTIIPGPTGLPPSGTTYTNKSSMPVTTMTVSGTGGTRAPSASSIIHTLTSIMPPISNHAVSAYMLHYRSVIALVVGAFLLAMLF